MSGAPVLAVPTADMLLLACCCRRYSNADVTNTFVHLTNVAIQKGSDTYNEQTGGKWDLRNLKLHMISRVGKKATDKLFMEMQNIVVRSLQSVQKIMINDKHCFELYVVSNCVAPRNCTPDIGRRIGMATTSCMMTN